MIKVNGVYPLALRGRSKNVKKENTVKASAPVRGSRDIVPVGSRGKTYGQGRALKLFGEFCT